MNLIYSLTAFMGLFFLLTGGALIVVLTEKWNWLDRKGRNAGLLIVLLSFSLAILCFIKLLTIGA
jgi:hypothetical protein